MYRAEDTNLSREMVIKLMRKFANGILSITLILFLTAVTLAQGAWRNLGPGGGSVNALVIDPTDPMTLYAGTEDGGVFKSTNRGANWSAINNGLTNLSVKVLVIDPIDPMTLYAGTSFGGVFESTDGGANWSAINNGLTNTFISALAVDPINPMWLYAGTHSDGVFKSTDRGANWSAINNGLPTFNGSIFTRVLAIAPTNPRTLYAGVAGGYFRSNDGGAFWAAINNGLGTLGDRVRALVIDPTNPRTLYAGTDGGVFVSAFTTVLAANFMNGNNSAFNSRVYLWNPSNSAGEVTVRVFTLPRKDGLAQELTTTPLSLGSLGAGSALNIRVAEDILDFVPGITTPYTNDDGDLTLEFTIQAIGVRGATQVFSSSLAFGVYPVQQIPSTSAGSPTVLVANFMNGNDDVLNSRVYLWNPSASAGDVTVRVFTLPIAGGLAEELTTTPLNLGSLEAKSALNIKLAEDILDQLPGITTPYKTDGGNLTLEFTIQAADVVGAAQVFSSSFAFGVYPVQQIPSTSAGSPTVLVANFMNGNDDVLNSRVYLWNPSASAGDVTVRVFTLPIAGGLAEELTTTPLNLGSLEAKSALNIKLAEDILDQLPGITTPYKTDGGNLTLEFTIQAADVVGAAQVFFSSFAFGTNPLQEVPSTSAGSPTVLVANFMNGNDDVLNSRVYLWNPSASAGDVTVRVFTLPIAGGLAEELTTTPLDLGSLEAESALNIKLAEDILDQLPGITTPYKTDGGNLTLEFTIQAADVRGAAQVFSFSLAFGTYPLQQIQ